MATIKVKVIDDYGTETIENWDLTRKVTPNFLLSELANTSAKEDVKFISTPASRKFIRMIQLMRSIENEGWTVSSNYRTKTFNASVNGDPNSCHVDGVALDRTHKGRTTAQKKESARLWKIICELFGEIGAINFYTNGEHYEIESDTHYGAKAFQIRDYRGKKGDW